MDLLTFAIDGRHEYDDLEPLYIDCDNPERTLSVLQVKDCVRRLISGLQNEGLQKGDCVNVQLFNSIYNSCIYLAAIGAGGIWSGSHPALTSDELQRHLRMTATKFVITSKSISETVVEAAQKCGIPKSRIFLFDQEDFDQALHSDFAQAFQTSHPNNVEQCPSASQLLHCGRRDWMRISSLEEAQRTTATFLTTTGTTGKPKIAEMSHYGIISEVKACREMHQSSYEVIRLAFLPSFHGYSIPATHIEPVLYGYKTYILPRFHLDSFHQSIERFAITDTAIVPAVAFTLARSSLQTSTLRSLRRVFCSGDTLQPIIQQQLQSVLPPEAMIDQVLGTTETGRISMNIWPRSSGLGCVGRPLSAVKVRLIDEDGNAVEKDGCPGEICVKSPSMMIGYKDDPVATLESYTREGWYRTGDLAYWESGELYTVCRLKELIKVRSWQVSPNELEATLMSHPGVKEAAVIGVAASFSDGEVPRAFIVLEDTHQHLKVEEVLAFMKEKHTGYKALAGGVKFIEEIPKSAGGKILRKKLRSSVEEDVVPQSNGHFRVSEPLLVKA